MTAPPVQLTAGIWTRAERMCLSGILGVATFLDSYASLADRFEYPGYGIVAVFVISWLVAAVLWRAGRFEQRYGSST
ncbi:hypothetical protein NE236_35430 [Actinoallomurus purpureus]|uniref:hypothetical protein n=1 Tax=Actinoallomurus purpureus TaxID=478114 RepID=UPI002093958D|nr:hypothetical protein [Actinoallomurus purpureus]MCO6010270.1 hypothetical protein [Actinoallomurus purpureus]